MVNPGAGIGSACGHLDVMFTGGLSGSPLQWAALAGRCRVHVPGRGCSYIRLACLLMILLIVPGCATMTYTSQKSAEEVSTCIANGWSNVPSSGIQLPVSLTREVDYYLVDVVLVRDLPTTIAFHSIWAKVRPATTGPSGGSTTEYRRNFQIMHKKIDRVVVTCQ